MLPSFEKCYPNIKDNKNLRMILEKQLPIVSSKFVGKKQKEFEEKYKGYINHGKNFRKGSKNYVNDTKILLDIKNEFDQILMTDAKKFKGMIQYKDTIKAPVNTTSYNVQSHITDKPIVPVFSQKLNDWYEPKKYEQNASIIRKMLSQYKGKNMVAIFYVNGDEIKRVEYGNVPINNYNKWYNADHWWDWIRNSNEDIFMEYENLQKKFKIFFDQKLVFLEVDEIQKSGFHKTQYFLDGIKHCVFTPIREWAINKFDESKAKSTKGRYQTILNKLDVLEEKYKDGLIESDVKSVCNTLQIDINISFPFHSENYISEQSSIKKLKVFNYINTRMDHLELNEINNIDNEIEVNNVEIMEIYKDCVEKGIYCQKRKNLDNEVIELVTQHKKYFIRDEYNETSNNFKNKYRMNDFRISHIKNYDLSAFVRNSVHYNTTIDFQNVNIFSKIRHIDMEKAYAKFNLCKYYDGFLEKRTKQ